MCKRSFFLLLSCILLTQPVQAFQVPFVSHQNNTKFKQDAYVADTLAGTVHVTGDGIAYLLRGDDEKRWVIREMPVAPRSMALKAALPSPTRIHRFRGRDPRTWESDLPTFAEVAYPDLWDGIDLRLRAGNRTVEKIFHLAPGAQPSAIAMAVDGPQRLAVNPNGGLDIVTGVGTFVMTPPVAWQESDGRREPVSVAYRLSPDGRAYSFSVGDYDRSSPLIIDPLLATTFLGGDNDESPADMAVDSQGNIYVVGYTDTSSSSPPVNLPVTPGAYDGAIGPNTDDRDVFIARLSPDMTSLLALTYLGGPTRIDTSVYGWAPRDYGKAVTVDSAGNVFICGTIGSRDFPLTEGAHNSTITRSDAFVAKFSPDLGTLMAATAFTVGYWNDEDLSSILTDAQGNVYAAGWAGDGELPTDSGYDTTGNGWEDAIVVKFDNDLTTLLAATFLGAEQTDKAWGIALDSAGNVFIAGETQSTAYKESTFPVTPGAFSTQYTGCMDAYVAKFSPDLKTLMAATFLGGDASEQCGYTTSFGSTVILDLAVDAADTVYVAGRTDARSFPMTPRAFDVSHNGGQDGFVARFSSDLSGLMAATYVGGAGYGGEDKINTLALDAAGNVYIAGQTSSDDFPVTTGADDATLGPWMNWDNRYDGFVAELNGGLDKMIYATYFGGQRNETIHDLIVEGSKTVLVTGDVYEPIDFPVADAGYDPEAAGALEVFISRLEIPHELAVEVIAPRRVSPGEDAVFLVRYHNGMDETAADVVVALDLPRRFVYRSSTDDGVYRNDRDYHQVFWRLGDLAPADGGELAATARVPWGLPDGEDAVFADIGGSNDPTNVLDIDAYLAYDPRTTTSDITLTPAQLEAALAVDPGLKTLRDHVVSLGYVYMNLAQAVDFDDGNGLTRLFYLDPVDKVPAILESDGGRALAQKRKGTEYTLFDVDGGFMLDAENQVFRSWGTWAETEDGLRRSFLSDGASFGKCQALCMIEQLPSWGAGLFLGPVGAVLSGIDCVKCGSYFWASTESCTKCASALKGVPGIEQVVDISACAGKCAGDPKQYDCTEEVIECGQSATAWLIGDTQTVYKTPCKAGVKGWRASQGNCAVNERCIPGCGCEGWEACKDRKSKKQRRAAIRVTAAKDPNAKSVAPSGDVLPGQEMTYAIEYENVGAGTAYGVFILDEIDLDLDETTLTLADGGAYAPDARLLSWDIGELPPCTEDAPDACKGSVSFKVNVRNGLPSGTEILNVATVYFPSSDEVTPTNAVRNTVRGIVADPKSVETTAGQPVNIALTGRDGGSGGLSFHIETPPLHGALAGAPPTVVYTPAESFSGGDDFTYVADNGVVRSEPARVTIRVAPDPADATPPSVRSVFPENGAMDIHVSDTPTATDPAGYIPTLRATFAEPLNPSTVTDATFTVDGLPGRVAYDAATFTATFAPTAPLSTARSYTARLKTGIQDAAGNGLSEEFTWTFTTESAVNIAAVLPDDADRLLFGAALTGADITERIVSLSNTGGQPLEMGTIAIGGSDPDDFTLAANGCSNASLAFGENCTVRVTFTPTGPGSKTAVLTVPSNDPDTATLEVTLRGGIEPGDLDGSGAIDLADVFTGLKVAAGIRPVTAFLSADADGNGRIDLADVAFVLQKAAGLR